MRNPGPQLTKGPRQYDATQRGSNENTDGLLRQYVPKGWDVSGYSQRQLDDIAMRLNQRPNAVKTPKGS